MATFEERLRRLEQLGEKLRQGNLPIDDAAALFEEGIKLARGLEGDLAKLERRIEILINDPETSGEPPQVDLFPDVESAASAESPHGAVSDSSAE